MKTLTFFNNKGGVGKTSLVYHLSWMFAELGKRVVAIDLDPQSNLTSAFLDEERVEELWQQNGSRAGTIFEAISPLLKHEGDFKEPHIEHISEHIGLVAGDLGLSGFEDLLADSWGRCLSDNRADKEFAFRVTTAFYRIMTKAAAARNADIVVVDVGPNLGALNRAALIAADFIVVPLAADLFSLHGLRNLGPTLSDWRRGWSTRRDQVKDQPKNSPVYSVLPVGSMSPIGYIVMQPSVRERYPVKAYRKWTDRIPGMYHTKILNEPDTLMLSDPDPELLATIKNYRSLAPLAHDARKPIFLLRPADGAVGGHLTAVKKCYEDFERLAKRIAKTIKSQP